MKQPFQAKNHVATLPRIKDFGGRYASAFGLLFLLAATLVFVPLTIS